MRPVPIFVLLFAGAMFLLPQDEPQAGPTLAPCQCAQGGDCTCGTDCDCEPKPLVSVVKPAVQTKHDLSTPINLSTQINRSKSLGYGAPTTLAPTPDLIKPVSDTRPSLTPAEAQTAQKLFAKNHPPIERAVKAAVRAPAKAVKAPVRWIRVFAGTTCNGGVCSPSYRWVRSDQYTAPSYAPQYAEPVQRYQPMRRGWLRRR